MILGVMLCFVTLICLEKIYKRGKLSSEILRRAAHAGSTLIVIIFSLFLSPIFFITSLCLFLIIILISRKKGIFKHIHNVSRTTVGEELLPLGFLTSYLIANGQQNIYIPAFLIVGFADPLTGIIMEKYKNHLIGMLVFFIATFLILLFFKIPFIIMLYVALLTAFIERISGYGTDNISVPVTISLLLRFIR